jgi:hypothetical protein
MCAHCLLPAVELTVAFGFTSRGSYTSTNAASERAVVCRAHMHRHIPHSEHAAFTLFAPSPIVMYLAVHIDGLS